MRRLSTSAIETRSTSTTANLPNPACYPRGFPQESSLCGAPSRLRCRAASGALLSRRANRGFMGQGSTGYRSMTTLDDDRSPRSFSPTHSIRAPLVARSWRCGPGKSLYRQSFEKRMTFDELARDATYAAPAWDIRLREFLRKGRLLHPPAKGNTISCTQDAFRRWTTPSGAGPPPQTVPSLWTMDRRLFDLRFEWICDATH